jgi:hypothetical protein
MQNLSRCIAVALTAALFGAACSPDRTEVDAGGEWSPVPPSVPVIGTLEITVTHPDVAPVVYSVGCLGDTFPVTPEVAGVDGGTACGLLADPTLFDRLVNGPPADQVCTEIYGGPDEARITGQIDDLVVDTTITRSNGCEIDTWERLQGLLPPAIGVTE